MFRCLCKINTCFTNAVLDKIHLHNTLRMLHITKCALNSDLSRPSSIIDNVRKEIAEDKKEIEEWHNSLHDPSKEWGSKLKLFANMDQNSDFIIAMQQPIDLSPKSLKKWWTDRREGIERFTQQYVQERHNILGNDLAAAHFLLYRGGSVKFVHNKEWMRANKDKEFDLPNKFDPKYKVEALRCDNMELYYEGLENLRNLEHLKFISFHNVAPFDDWCLDRVSGSQYPALEVLDISATQCTVNGLTCLYRIPTLKLLIVDDQKQSVEYELMCTLLEEGIPNLKVVNAETVHGVKEKLAT